MNLNEFLHHFGVNDYRFANYESIKNLKDIDGKDYKTYEKFVKHWNEEYFKIKSLKKELEKH